MSRFTVTNLRRIVGAANETIPLDGGLSFAVDHRGCGYAVCIVSPYGDVGDPVQGAYSTAREAAHSFMDYLVSGYRYGDYSFEELKDIFAAAEYYGLDTPIIG